MTNTKDKAIEEMEKAEVLEIGDKKFIEYNMAIKFTEKAVEDGIRGFVSKCIEARLEFKDFDTRNKFEEILEQHLKTLTTKDVL